MKSIRKPQDLAIYDAPPAFAEQLHVGRPNIGSRDLLMKDVDDILDRRWLTNDGPMVHRLEQRVAELHGVKHCVAMCNGTVALEIAIQADAGRDLPRQDHRFRRHTLRTLSRGVKRWRSRS